MFNKDFDPLARLEALEIKLFELARQQEQVINALNHHAQALQALNECQFMLNQSQTENEEKLAKLTGTRVEKK